MSRYLNLGNAGFQSIRRGLYVDKTGLIEYVNRTLGTKDKLICVSRPRRFGKTMAMSMLADFFDIRKDSRSLFDGLKITKNSILCRKWMNQWPVIFFSLKDIDGLTFQSAYGQLLIQISNLYKEFNVQTWSKRFDEFKGKKFVFKGTSSANNPSQVYVNTEVPVENGKPIDVKWRVYEHNGKMKIIDIIIENVSLAQTARNEYTSYIAKSPNGVDGLLENLRTKVK